MNKIKILTIICYVLGACSTQKPTTNLDIIPAPDQMKPLGGIVNYSSARIASLPFALEATGMIEISTKGHNMEVELDTAMDEGYYMINADYNSLLIKTGSESGLRYAMNTIEQLRSLNEGRLPAVEVQDGPHFAYRGMHLDVGRHMFAVEDIKRYIDYLALYKFNKFHWHLTEDQGWRIEIKAYPKLMEIGAYRKETLIGHYRDQPHQYDQKKYGGYYTQAEAKDIVAYASSKGIEVIPEIEMPGHSLAALAAYPELGCTGGPYEVATEWGVFNDVYCPTEKTFEFLENVIDEIITIFPSEYIHIGGDECPKITWENSSFCQALMKKEGLEDTHQLQSYFITRMERYINSKGKRIIGWDEILEGGLAPNATVMSWRGEDGGIEAAKQGHDVIMTPTNYAYFDYYQSDHTDEPLAIGGYLPLERVYGWNPIPQALTEEEAKYVLGGQGNVWTEYMPDFEKVTYMALARMIALSEVLWKAPNKKSSYEDFKVRLATHTAMWEDKNVNIANHLLDIKAKVHQDAGNGTYVKNSQQYETYISKNDGPPELMQGNIHILTEEGRYTLFHKDNGKVGRKANIHFKPHKGNFATIDCTPLPAIKYSGLGPQSLVNGVRGIDSGFSDNEWLGFEGGSPAISLNWSEPIIINNVHLRFFGSEGQWVYLPKSIRIEIDGKMIYESNIEKGKNKIASISIPLKGITANNMLVTVENHGIIASGKQGAGNRAWVFVDEIVIE